MKYKLVDILNINTILSNIINKDKEQNVDIVLKFKFLNIMKTLEKHVENFERLRQEYFEQYSHKNESEQLEIKTNSKEMDMYINELNRLVTETEVEVDIPKIPLQELNGLGLSAAELTAIFYIIEEVK